MPANHKFDREALWFKPIRHAARIVRFVDGFAADAPLLLSNRIERRRRYRLLTTRAGARIRTGTLAPSRARVSPAISPTNVGRRR